MHPATCQRKRRRRGARPSDRLLGRARARHAAPRDEDRRNAKKGLASLCLGGGNAVALAVEMLIQKDGASEWKSRKWRSSARGRWETASRRCSRIAGIPVVMIDIKDEFVQRGIAAIDKSLDRLVKKEVDQREARRRRCSAAITGSTNLGKINGCRPRRRGGLRGLRDQDEGPVEGARRRSSERTRSSRRTRRRSRSRRSRRRRRAPTGSSACIS